jgi:hypothetical protein
LEEFQGLGVKKIEDVAAPREESGVPKHPASYLVTTIQITQPNA